MIYAGTIILNLLAASIDDRFTSRQYQLNNSTTVTTIMDSLQEGGGGEEKRTVGRELHKKKKSSFSIHSSSSYVEPKRRGALSVEYFINRPQCYCYFGMDNGFFNEHEFALHHTNRNGEISYESLSI